MLKKKENIYLIALEQHPLNDPKNFGFTINKTLWLCFMIQLCDILLIKYLLHRTIILNTS